MIRHGEPPFLECSSKGDKRFSAFYAEIKCLGNRRIEAVFQAAKIFEDGSTGLSIKEAKGRKAVNSDELQVLYSELWNTYISEIFGQTGHVCQATELWRIRNEN
jgi:hypothetical protein